MIYKQTIVLIILILINTISGLQDFDNYTTNPEFIDPEQKFSLGDLVPIAKQVFDNVSPIFKKVNKLYDYYELAKCTIQGLDDADAIRKLVDCGVDFVAGDVLDALKLIREKLEDTDKKVLVPMKMECFQLQGLAIGVTRVKYNYIGPSSVYPGFHYWVCDANTYNEDNTGNLAADPIILTINRQSLETSNLETKYKPFMTEIKTEFTSGLISGGCMGSKYVYINTDKRTDLIIPLNSYVCASSKDYSSMSVISEEGKSKDSCVNLINHTCDKVHPEDITGSCVEITFINGVSISATEDHLFYDQKWKLFRELTVGSSLNGQEVIKVTNKLCYNLNSCYSDDDTFDYNGIKFSTFSLINPDNIPRLPIFIKRLISTIRQ